MTMEQANQRIKDAWTHDLARSKSIPEDIGKIFTGWVRNRTNEALSNAKAKANNTTVAEPDAEAEAAPQQPESMAQ